MMKLRKSLILVIFISLFLNVFTNANASEVRVDHVHVTINKRPMHFEQPPILLNNTTMVPMRKIFEELGAEISWHENIQTVTGTRDNRKIQLHIGSTVAVVNGKYVILEQAPVVVKGNTMVPLRLVSEALGTQVNWDQQTRTVSIIGVSSPLMRPKSSLSVNTFKNKGKIVIGTSAEYPPYEFYKIINGKASIIGSDIKIANRIARELGVSLEIKDMKFGELINALKNDEVDMVIASMSPTEERKKVVDFSNLYYVARQAIVVRAEERVKYMGLKDLSGTKISVQGESTQEYLVRKQLKNANISTHNRISEVFSDLTNKRADAVVVSSDVAYAYINRNNNLFISPVQLVYEDFGSAIAFKKGTSPETIDGINQIIRTFIENNEIVEWVAEAHELVE
ncbi:transporter substrate-binding domain-containing protein [Paenibacillus sp. GD4]|uniref:stalk domain-containing protein n=1 Tax=Paenibacillus sp. GD4 TaxID=3068890 RepID=UPI002796D1FD|nr:transporter substrate-binding domain-containing protein [Paenibacillus sp. GD4]MDQ1914047.1 transporter substrate-binding domain-containing protein [Paenibacillus sp. GD4]